MQKTCSIFAHTLNLVAERALEESGDLKVITQKVKTSYFGSDEVWSLATIFEKKQKKLCSQFPQNPIYEIIKRFLESFVNAIMNKHRKTPPTIPASETDILEVAFNIFFCETDILEVSCEILQPLEAATTTISSDVYGTSTLVKPIISIVREKLSKLRPQNNCIKMLLNQIDKQIMNRFASCKWVTHLIFVTLFDSEV